MAGNRYASAAGGAPTRRAFFVAVAGTHSTGKTTFLQELRPELKGLGLGVRSVGNLARSALDLGFGILRDHSFESTLWIVTRGISEELEAALASDVVLVDRPVLDALGYLKAALNYRQTDLAKEEWEYLRNIVKGHIPRYDLVFRTVLDHETAIDTTKDRDLDPAYRKHVADCISGVFEDFGVDAFELCRGQRSQAVARGRERIAAHFGLQSTEPGTQS